LEPWIQRDARVQPLRAAATPQLLSLVTEALVQLDQARAGRAWLVGEHFTVADLNVCAVLSPSRAQHLDLEPYPHIRDWLARCYGRPAAVATRRRFQG
jgi:glutathione S-transferase